MHFISLGLIHPTLFCPGCLQLLVFSLQMWISFALSAGARMSPALTLACAFALLVGGALSAGISDFLLARAECDFATAERRREQWELGMGSLLLSSVFRGGLCDDDARNYI